MKTQILLCFIFLFGRESFSQEYEKAIKSDADRMNIAFLIGDVNTILNYTYPKVFEMIGDRDYMAELITHYVMQMQNEGYTLDTATISSPGPVVIAGNELHCFINQTIYSTFPGGTLKNDVPLLAVSTDGGLHWYFVDMRQVSREMLKTLFPQFNPELKIPALPQPVVIYNDGFVKEE